MVTINTWLNNSPLPRMEARILLQSILKLSHAQVITNGYQVIPSNLLIQLSQLEQRRLNGEPIAYLIHEKEFYGRTFYINHHVLIPRCETELLIDLALKKLPENPIIWDIATGSGVIAITIALERSCNQVWASDISHESLNVAKYNSEKLGACIKLTQGSWFHCHTTPTPESCDLITSNPPYIHHKDPHLQQGDLRFEPQHALTDFADGLSAYQILASQAPKFLKPSGWLMLEHGYNQGHIIRTILHTYKYKNIQTFKDLSGIQRVTVGQIIKT